MIELTEAAIDFTTVTESVRSNAAGAVVLFMGTVREFTGDVQTSSLRYDVYPEMATQSMQQLEQEARERWGLVDVAMVHRTGHLDLGEIAVAVAVSAGHRKEAFEAGRWLIDTLKEQVPIWKKEHYAGGETEWIHADNSGGQNQTSTNETVEEGES